MPTITLLWAGPRETVSCVQGAAKVQGAGFVVVEPVAIPVVMAVVTNVVSLSDGEKAKAATIVARYLSWTSSTPLVTALPEGCGGGVVVVVVAAAVVVVVVDAPGAAGAETTAGVAVSTGPAVGEGVGMLNRGNVSVS